MNEAIIELFKDKCPGTYKHCNNVAMLCETVANELLNEVNKDYLVLASKYHDIGKMNNPEYFSENQATDINPHDDLEPHCSFQYISRHVADSVLKLIQVGDIPQEVILIISEHHGDSVVGGIFNSAKKNNPNIEEDHFRYKNRKPTTLESAILMICDVVESACRSLHNNGKLEKHKLVIDKLIDKLIDDMQLDILTIGHLRVIRGVLYKEIESTYHKRVDYEEEENAE